MEKSKGYFYFQKGSYNRLYIANYRPISLLCIPSKLLEHQVCNIIDEHLNKSSLKSSSQWDFTKGLSSEGMLLWGSVRGLVIPYP